jgi:hypothetical protein
MNKRALAVADRLARVIVSDWYYQLRAQCPELVGMSKAYLDLRKEAKRNGRPVHEGGVSKGPGKRS